MKLITKLMAATAVTSAIGVATVCAVTGTGIPGSQSEFFGQQMPDNITKAEVADKFREIAGKKSGPKRSEAIISLNEGDIYAYLGGGNYSKTMGMYRLFQDGGYEYMWSEDLLANSFVMQTGWLRDGNLCGFAQFGVGTWILGYAYEEVDLATGQAVSTPHLIDLEDNYLGYYQIAAYNPDNDRIYGYGYVEKARDKSVFKSSPASEPWKASIVKQEYVASEACLALCYNDSKGTLAGINLNHEFVYIDSDGNQTSVMELGIEGLQNIVSAMTWSAADGYYIFNAIVGSGTSELYAIDPEEKSVTLLSPVSDGLTFAFMVSGDTTSDPDAPAVPQITALKFEEGDNDGMLVFDMPSVNGKGDYIYDRMEYTVWVDGKVWEHSIQNGGERVCVNFRNISDGEHVFRVAASLDGKTSPKATVRQYVGNDTPKAPENVEMTFTKVTWEPVTESTHGGYMNLDELEYEVYINDEWYGSTEETMLEIELPEGDLTPYTAYVYASCMGKESVASASNTIVYGDPLELDVEIIPTEEQAEIVTVLDSNHDESTWHPRFYQGSTVFSYYADKVNPGDDWLFMPGISFDDSLAVYEVSFENCYYNTARPEEFFEIWLCAAPDTESDRHCILEKTQPKSKQFETTAVTFTVPSKGVWYVAFRAVSNPDQMYLNIRNIRISKTSASLNGPAEVSPIGYKDMTSGTNFRSEVTFRLPETMIDGTAIDPSTILTATVKGLTEEKVTGKPGDILSATVEVSEGFSNVFIQTSFEGGNGAETFIKVYAGPDAPGRVNDFSAKASEDNNSVRFSWTPPTIGVNGGSVDPSGITYHLMLFNGKIWMYPQVDIIDNSCVYTIEDTETLADYIFSIEASNDKGDTDKNQPILMVQLGKPHELPVTETFPEAQISINPLEGNTYDQFSGTEWGLADPAGINPSFDLDGRSVMIGSASEENRKGSLIFPKFSSVNVTDYVAVKLLIWTGTDSADMTLFAEAAGDNSRTEIRRIPKGDGWEIIEFTLPKEMSGCEWIQIWLESEYTSASDRAMVGEYMFYVSKEQIRVGEIESENPAVMTSRNHISILAPEDSTVGVWSVDGIPVSITTAGTEPIELSVNSGIYIVRVNQSNIKVRVK